MADQGFPPQHTTTTTVTSNTQVQTNLRYDPSYIRTRPGALKVAQLVLNLLGFISIESSIYVSGRASWFSTISMTGVWFTGILLVFYLFHLIEKFFKIPWLKIEFFFCGIIGVLYLIFSILCATFNSQAYTVAAFFGFCATVAYFYDAFLKYVAVRSGEIAQGDRQITKETSIVTSPAY